MDNFAGFITMLNKAKDELTTIGLRCLLETNFLKSHVICSWNIQLSVSNTHSFKSRLPIMGANGQNQIEQEAKQVNDILCQILCDNVQIIYAENTINDIFDQYICAVLNNVRINSLAIEFSSRDIVLSRFPRNNLKKLYIISPYDDVGLNIQFVTLIKFMYEDIQINITFRNSNTALELSKLIYGSTTQLTNLRIPAGPLEEPPESV